jgi:RNA polymerase sigma-70 factor (ECF subfamily)
LSSSVTTRLSLISTSKGNSTADERTVAKLEISDEVLLARVGDGDKEGLACLFHRYARLVRAVGYKILRDDSEADDLLQDVFLFIHQKSTVFDSSKSSARSWIVQMAYHRAIDRRRYLDSRHFYTQVDLEDVRNELSGPGEKAGRYESSIEEVLGRIGLRKVFGVLSEIQRQTLGLHLLDGYTFEEIAAKLDQSRGNVKHHYFPLPVIPRISEWATSPLCKFRKYGVLLSVSSTARYSVPRWAFVFSPGRIVKRNDRSA